MSEERPSRIKEITSFAKPVFLKWEKLRIVYNLILLVILLISRIPAMGNNIFEPWALGSWLVGAVLANLCFFLGPLSETYIAWLGWRSVGVTVIIFAVGVLVSIPLVIFFPPMTAF